MCTYVWAGGAVLGWTDISFAVFATVGLHLQFLKIRHSTHAAIYAYVIIISHGAIDLVTVFVDSNFLSRLCFIHVRILVCKKNVF